MTDSVTAEGTFDEAASSWAGWVRTAEAAGDDELAHHLVEAAPTSSLDPHTVSVVLARSAILSGQPQDAVDQLHATELGPPRKADALDAVAAAARAATTAEVTEYRWLIAYVAHVRGTGDGASALRLLAAVADLRGDRATADGAWEELVTGAGLHTHQALARLASTIVTRRDREDRPASLVALAVHAAGVGLAGPPSDHPDVEPVSLAATSLVDRGDPAGAALLLRAVRALAAEADSTSIDATLAEVVPLRHRRAFAGLRAASATAGVALGLVATSVDSRTWLLVPILAVVGYALWGRFARLGPLTATERRAWRDLARLRVDGATGEVRGRERDALGALLAILGAMAGIAAAVQASIWVTDGLGLSSTGILAGVWILVAPAPAVASLALLWSARAALDRRARRKRVATEERRERSAAERCVCWHSAAIIGRHAVYYLEEHLGAVPTSGTLGVTLDAVRAGTTTARCPVSGILWLAVPTSTKTLLLLKGAIVTIEPVPPTSSGFYL